MSVYLTSGNGGATLTDLNATQLTSGTVPTGRFPSTLPAASGVNLTGLNASNIASGTLAAARLPATAALLDAANAWSDGVKQTFNPNATNAGLNIGAHAGDPSTLADGDVWLNTSTNALKARVNGATVTINVT